MCFPLMLTAKLDYLSLKAEVRSISSHSENEGLNNINTHTGKGFFLNSSYTTETAMSISGIWLLFGLVRSF